MRSQVELEKSRSTAGPRESFTELLVDLAAQSATLVREEVSLARQELLEGFKQVRPSLLIFAFGLAAGAFSGMALMAALILALSQYWKPWQAAFAVGGGIAVIAAALIAIGLGWYSRS